MKPNIYSQNMKALRKNLPELAKLISGELSADCEYIIEESKSKELTLALKTGDKTTQIHSKYDPAREAKQQIEKSELVNPKLLVICGLGLGYHVKAALETFKKDISCMFVIERDLSAFRIAVEHVDLSDLFKDKRIKWLIGLKETEAYAACYNAINREGLSLQLYLKTITVFSQPVLTTLYADYYKEIMRHFREAAHATIFNYGNSSDDSLIGLNNILDNINIIIRNPGIKDLYNGFKGVPGIIVSTGPSLSKNIETLKQAVGKSVIVAADASLAPMYKKNIKPDMTVSLERITKTGHIYEELSEDYKKDIYLAATPVIMNMAYEQWNGPKIIVYRDFAHFKWIGIEKGILPIGPSCSNQAFQILKAMGCDPIILVGQDCAFESAEKTHADDVSSVTKLNLRESDLIKVKGNYTDWVYTNNIYNIFRKNFVTDIASYAGKCINATEGGAFIEGSELMTLQEAIDKYCTNEIDVKEVCNKKLKIPSESDVVSSWSTFKRVLKETINEVEEVISACDKGAREIEKFEERLANEGYNEIEDFLERFPEKDLDSVYLVLNKLRLKVITSGKYFNLFLMHIIQMIIIHFEIEFNALPSMSQDQKRCRLQAIKMLKRWFPQIRDVSRRSLEHIKSQKAENFRNESVFERVILENKPLFDISWEEYKKTVLAKNPGDADKHSLLFYYAKEQENMRKANYYMTQKDLERHQVRIAELKEALKSYFNLEV